MRLDQLPDIIRRAQETEYARRDGHTFGYFSPNEALDYAWAVTILADREAHPPEELERDAARYRWLRDVCAYEAWHAYVITPPAAMDAAIDKGMAASSMNKERS
jgi:hypothetical protein